MKFDTGQAVELSKEGHRTFDNRSHKKKTRTTGEVVGKSFTYPDCYRVKWINLKTPEVVHEKFLKAIVPIEGRK